MRSLIITLTALIVAATALPENPKTVTAPVKTEHQKHQSSCHRFFGHVPRHCFTTPEFYSGCEDGVNNRAVSEDKHIARTSKHQHISLAELKKIRAQEKEDKAKLGKDYLATKEKEYLSSKGHKDNVVENHQKGKFTCLLAGWNYGLNQAHKIGEPACRVGKECYGKKDFDAACTAVLDGVTLDKKTVGTGPGAEFCLEQGKKYGEGYKSGAFRPLHGLTGSSSDSFTDSLTSS
jgi:hypothetical protein